MRARPGRPLISRVKLPIRTRRLLLIAPARSGVPALVPLVGDWRVARPTRLPHPYSARDGYFYVRASAKNRRKGKALGLWILDTKDQRLLGGVGLHEFDWTDRRAELGYWIAPSEWGKGIAPEAAHALCRVAFRTLHLHRIEAHVYAFNPRSARVLRKLGFRREGRARSMHRDGRGWVDVINFGLLAVDLRAPG